MDPDLYRFGDHLELLAGLSSQIATLSDMATAPRSCSHASTHEQPFMDGKGNVIGRHIVCNDCGMIIGTR